MKTLRLLALSFGLFALGFLFTGCTSTAGAIEAAATRLEVHQGKNKGMTIVLPKEMDTSALHLKIDPATGVITLDADKLKSSSQAIIESAGAAQANALATLSNTVAQIVPILAKAAAAAVDPAAAPVIAAETVAAPVDPAPPPATAAPTPQPTK